MIEIKYAERNKGTLVTLTRRTHLTGHFGARFGAHHRPCKQQKDVSLSKEERNRPECSREPLCCVLGDKGLEPSRPQIEAMKLAIKTPRSRGNLTQRAQCAVRSRSCVSAVDVGLRLVLQSSVGPNIGVVDCRRVMR